MKFELAHTQWHNMIYRTALLSVEGGLQAAQMQLEAVREHQRPLCGECEKDELIRRLADATKHNTSPQIPSPVLCRETKKRVIISFKIFQ